MSVTWNHEIRDGNMIYREGCCLSTDTKPTSDPTLGNGSKLLEMDTSEKWIYDADGCEWFGPDGALNDTIRFIRPKLIYNDEYVGIDFRLKLPAGKTPSDYPGSYVKFDGIFNVTLTTHTDGTAARSADSWSLSDFSDGVCHFTICAATDVAACVYTPTFYYTEDGVSKTVVGVGYSVENQLEFEIARNVGRYAEELKAYTDMCYYSLRYRNNDTQSRYPNTTLRYNIYNRSYVENRITFSNYNDHYYEFEDDDIPWTAFKLNIGPKISVACGVQPASGYAIQSFTINDVSASITTAGEVKLVTSERFPIMSGLADIYVFKVNDVVRVKSSYIGYFKSFVDAGSYESVPAMQNWAYAVLQYAKITHQI